MKFLLVVSDTLRLDHLGCYGNPCIHTPHLHDLVEQSVVFDRCYPASFPTMPHIDDMERGVVEPLSTTVRDDDWTLICASQGQAVEFYRTAEEPGQLCNVIEDNEAPARELHGAFIQFLEQVGTADRLIAPRRQLL